MKTPEELAKEILKMNDHIIGIPQPSTNLIQLMEEAIHQRDAEWGQEIYDKLGKLIKIIEKE